MSLHQGDKPAAFAGLIGGTLLVLAMVVVIVQWTNTQFEGHKAAPAAGAPATTH
jgi:hypothetical protein